MQSARLTRELKGKDDDALFSVGLTLPVWMVKKIRQAAKDEDRTIAMIVRRYLEKGGLERGAP